MVKPSTVYTKSYGKIEPPTFISFEMILACAILFNGNIIFLVERHNKHIDLKSEFAEIKHIQAILSDL